MPNITAPLDRAAGLPRGLPPLDRRELGVRGGAVVERCNGRARHKARARGSLCSAAPPLSTIEPRYRGPPHDGRGYVRR
jgi:hypothetical protein